MSDTLLKPRSVRLSDEQVTGLKTLAKAQDRDWTELIRLAVKDLIKNGRKNGKRK